MSPTVYNHEKMYTYIKGYATGAGMKETLKALSFAREKHSGQPVSYTHLTLPTKAEV